MPSRQLTQARGCSHHAPMQLMVNGRSEDREVRTAGELLDVLGIARERVAVLINEQVIRRAHLNEALLQAGDQVEIITMVGGG